jgi:hypothetical protein
MGVNEKTLRNPELFLALEAPRRIHPAAILLYRVFIKSSSNLYSNVVK